MSKSRNTVAPLHAALAIDSVVGSEREAEYLIKSGAEPQEILLYAQGVQSKMDVIERYARSFRSREINRARNSARSVARLVRDI